jgi:hypothetical protein
LWWICAPFDGLAVEFFFTFAVRLALCGIFRHRVDTQKLRFVQSLNNSSNFVRKVPGERCESSVHLLWFLSEFIRLDQQVNLSLTREQLQKRGVSVKSRKVHLISHFLLWWFAETPAKAPAIRFLKHCHLFPSAFCLRPFAHFTHGFLEKLGTFLPILEDMISCSRGV